MTSKLCVDQPNRPTFLTGRLFPDGIPTQVEVVGGRIASTRPATDLPENATRQRWVGPGFYDLQVNGFAGMDLCDPRVGPAELHKMAEAILKTGCTRFLATIITGDLDSMCARLAEITQAIESDPLLAAMCPGLHAEGPFIHPEDGPRGAHPRQHVRVPNIADFQRLCDACRGRMKILTLAPEQPGAAEVIRAAADQGVIVALGHHRADPASIEAAIAAGARMTTHLGNGSDAVLPRTANYIWTQLAEDRLWASMIADGHHLSAAALKTMIRAKTPDRTVLITDAMAAAAMPPGRFLLGDCEVVKTPEGRVCLPGTPYLAGSAAEMPMVVSHAVTDGGLSLVDAVRMATLQPSCLVPTEFDPWACAPGKPANLIEFEWDPDASEIEIRQAAIGPFVASAA